MDGRVFACAPVWDDDNETLTDPPLIFEMVPQSTVALLVGGALRGGRVIADWPGVKDSNLFENRDLKATTDLRAVLKGLLRDHLRVGDRALATVIFPSVWPDLLVGLGIAVMNTDAAREVWRAAREEHQLARDI